MFHPVAATQTTSVLKLDGIAQQNVYSNVLCLCNVSFLSENGLDQGILTTVT